MPDYFTTADGALLAYSDEGEGLPLLCLPGLTRTRADFDYLLPHLPPCRVIRMDYRGRGDSAWTGAASYTVPQEAQDVIALLNHLGVAKVAVLGTSRGGLIGMVLAILGVSYMTHTIDTAIFPHIRLMPLEWILIAAAPVLAGSLIAHFTAQRTVMRELSKLA